VIGRIFYFKRKQYKKKEKKAARLPNPREKSGNIKKNKNESKKKKVRAVADWEHHEKNAPSKKRPLAKNEKEKTPRWEASATPHRDILNE
jgi:hypothetical protein